MTKFVFFIAVIALPLSDGQIKKIISDKEFRYEFYTTDKKVIPLKNREYFWFKGGSIHSSEYGIAGELLTDSYSKYYLNSQLAESGLFEVGLKKGNWKIWHPNGKIYSIQKWDRGREDGRYTEYNSEGTLVEKGNYDAGKKSGLWINYIRKDTIVYKKGLIFIKDTNARSVFRKRTPEQRMFDSINRVQKKKKNDSKRLTKKNHSKVIKKPADDKKKVGFFQRLLKSKKQKNRENDKG